MSPSVFTLDGSDKTYLTNVLGRARLHCLGYHWRGLTVQRLVSLYSLWLCVLKNIVEVSKPFAPFHSVIQELKAKQCLTLISKLMLCKLYRLKLQKTNKGFLFRAIKLNLRKNCMYPVSLRTDASIILDFNSNIKNSLTEENINFCPNILGHKNKDDSGRFNEIY